LNLGINVKYENIDYTVEYPH